ncbi:Bax inhibitor-1/YccA family protein [Rickettsiales endosymbiont of Stachyamoeba lipophora]|uniref:Bax inhibitor-1/YccA family protein n=1 Tax=Rickettsiales endosymbiont of Stachyamoeba lipophora TaxID=2486578 RepID=UPI000F647125|nr:Bax inhibitor-1/YccA family protein [Rickettsiales endosymbiont of Stachyamoeba lipophora]AZL15338.1 Bax inhibitor-1/YccA family protein [Rickettsiales endosymbiont of Stachyamoeba lipophora]
MNLNNNQQYAYQTKSTYDQGLRSFMLQTYNYMGLALLITGLVAMFAAGSESFIRSIISPQGMTGFGMLISFAPLGFVLALQFGINRMSLATAQMVYIAYSAVMGLSLSTLFMVYTGESIARVFFITAATFGAVSIFGYTTKRDLTQFASFLIMGLLGLVIASLVNIFLKSNGLMFVTSIIGVLVFTGLIAFETQKLKNMYYMLSSENETMGKISLLSALSLYISFINLFVSLLQLLGDRRNQ